MRLDFGGTDTILCLSAIGFWDFAAVFWGFLGALFWSFLLWVISLKGIGVLERACYGLK